MLEFNERYKTNSENQVARWPYSTPPRRRIANTVMSKPAPARTAAESPLQLALLASLAKDHTFMGGIEGRYILSSMPPHGLTFFEYFQQDSTGLY